MLKVLKKAQSYLSAKKQTNDFTDRFCFASHAVTEAGNTIEPARPVKLGHQEAPPFIQELLSQFAAVSTRVVLRGQSTFFHNEMCARLFMSTDQANELYASNTQASKRVTRLLVCHAKGFLSL